ncbi:MAG: hypothetical protein WBE37_24760 [Bryobacteraceae bacterium]
MRLAVLLLVPLLLLGEPAKLPEPFRALSDLAGAAPPEFGADALLRIVELGKLADKSARKQLIEQAFQLAISAKFPVRMEGLGGTTTDTASGSLSQAYALKLDVLSLQSRAVLDMLPLDPSTARELFGEIVKPTLAPLTCDDALVYEPSDYYQALLAVVNGTFTPKEKAKEEHVNLLLDALSQITSPSQLAPLARAIQSAGVTAEQHQILWARFGGLLESMQPDDRSFGVSLPAVMSLGVPQIQAQITKFQQRNHSCEVTDAIGPSSPDASAPAVKPSPPKLDRYWQSGTAKQLLQAGQKLRFKSSNQLLSDADRATPEWQQQLSDYLNLIADWTQDEQESDAVYYHEKCIVFTALLDLVDSGSQSDTILADYVDFIGNSGLYQQSPAEWFVEPHTVLDRSLPNAALHLRILKAYQDSGNPVLALEVALEKTFGTAAPWAASAR